MKYPKKYKLIKDLPFLPKGAIFEKVGNNWDCLEDINKFYSFDINILDGNPDWFEKILKDKLKCPYCRKLLKNYEK